MALQERVRLAAALIIDNGVTLRLGLRTGRAAARHMPCQMEWTMSDSRFPHDRLGRRCSWLHAHARRPGLAHDVVKVGAPLPLTGPLSPEGLKQKRGYDLWAEAANAKGIKAGGKTYKVEIVYADYASNTPRAVQTAERMITEDKVQFLFAPFGSGATKAASAISEKYRMPMLAPSASSQEIFDQGFKYIFATLTGNETCLGADRQAGRRQEQGHQARRHAGPQRSVPARGRAGVREGGQGRGHGGGDVENATPSAPWTIPRRSPRCAPPIRTGSTPPATSTT